MIEAKTIPLDLDKRLASYKKLVLCWLDPDGQKIVERIIKRKEERAGAVGEAN